MIKNIAMAATALTLLSAASASATTFTYDFLAAANAGGGIGESIYDSFDTSSAFTGPNLTVTASAGNPGNPVPAFVYFDNGNAGMGVCKTPDASGFATLNTATNGSANHCNPSSDDGITEVDEMLSFMATENMVIQSISFNSNHDGGLTQALTSMWTINGVSYDATADGTQTGGGNIRFDLGFNLNAGDAFSVVGAVSPDSYISAIAVSAVPLPASALMLGVALGGLGFARRKTKA